MEKAPGEGGVKAARALHVAAELRVRQGAEHPRPAVGEGEMHVGPVGQIRLSPFAEGERPGGGKIRVGEHPVEQQGRAEREKPRRLRAKPRELFAPLLRHRGEPPREELRIAQRLDRVEAKPGLHFLTCFRVSFSLPPVFKS